jgi:hypothetical protein
MSWGFQNISLLRGVFFMKIFVKGFLTLCRNPLTVLVCLGDVFKNVG